MLAGFSRWLLMTHDVGCRRKIRIPPHWTVDAEFCGVNGCFRPMLVHRWATGPLALFALMNPSAADTEFLDMTVSKTARIAQNLGYAGQIIVNACDYRATQQKQLLTVDPISPVNLERIAWAAAQADILVVAHGNLPGKLQHHADAMCAVLRASGKPLHVFALSKSGVPVHPMSRGKVFVRTDVRPILWDARG
jgi:hypothetical protein